MSLITFSPRFVGSTAVSREDLLAQTHLNIDALGAQGAHLPAGDTDGILHGNVDNVVARLGIVERHHVAIGVLGGIVAGVDLSFAHAGQQLSWQQLRQQGARPMDGHAPFSR